MMMDHKKENLCLQPEVAVASQKVALSCFDWTSGQQAVAGRVVAAYRGVVVVAAVDHR